MDWGGGAASKRAVGSRRLGDTASPAARGTQGDTEGGIQDQHHVGDELQASDEANLGTVPAWPPPAGNGENIDSSTVSAQASPGQPPRPNDAPMTHPTGDAVRETNSWLEWHHPGGPPSPKILVHQPSKTQTLSRTGPRGPCLGNGPSAWSRDARVRQPSFLHGSRIDSSPHLTGFKHTESQVD